MASRGRFDSWSRAKTIRAAVPTRIHVEDRQTSPRADSCRAPPSRCPCAGVETAGAGSDRNDLASRTQARPRAGRGGFDRCSSRGFVERYELRGVGLSPSRAGGDCFVDYGGDGVSASGKPGFSGLHGDRRRGASAYPVAEPSQEASNAASFGSRAANYDVKACGRKASNSRRSQLAERSRDFGGSPDGLKGNAG